MRILIMLLLLCLSGWASTPPAKTKPAVASASISDVDLERAIKARFAKSKISTNNFQVHVKNGVATIEGTASVIQHKGAATRIARTAGASQVVNNIKISDAARQKAGQQLVKSRKASVKK